MPGRRFESFASAPGAPERPADPAVRSANLRRIFPLFRPYRLRLSAVCALIVFSAAIGVISPFLLREVLDVAIPEENVRLLTALVAGMVAIPIVTGVIGVWQMLLSRTGTLARYRAIVRLKPGSTPARRGGSSLRSTNIRSPSTARRRFPSQSTIAVAGVARPFARGSSDIEPIVRKLPNPDRSGVTCAVRHTAVLWSLRGEAESSSRREKEP